MKISFRTKLQIAGWCAIFSPFVSIVEIIISLLNNNHYHLLYAHAFTQIVLYFISIYSFYYFMEYLDKMEGIRSLNTIIRLIIYASIMYVVIDAISELAFRGNILLIATIVGVFSVLIAILFIILSVKLMKLDKKYQALRRFGKWSLIANILEITVILTPIGIIFDIVASIMMGKILFRGAKGFKETKS